ncbi:MAG: glycosyltransferase family 4 protein [Terrimicrobiaceae bacterium]
MFDFAKRRASSRLGYLFERFPSYNQTFCAREVIGVRALGCDAPVFSIRGTEGEPCVSSFSGLTDTIRLPKLFDDILAGDRDFRREVRRAQEDLRDLWGSEADKRRIYEALWLKRQCRELGITHVHTHFVGLAARTAFWLNRLGGPTFSLTAHANDIFRDEPPERLAMIFQAASAVVTVSDFSAGFLRKNYPATSGKLHRVYNGIDPGRFPGASFPDGPPLILSVGRLIEKKGFDDLIAACGMLGQCAFQCEIIGDGPMENHLTEQIGRLGLSDRVRLLGPLREEDIAERLANARVFALPCVQGRDGSLDNLPTVIMEAMAAGLPVVSTALAGIPEMVRDGESGWLVPERCPDQLAEKLRHFLTNRELARKMGAEGHRLCVQNFSLDVTARALLEALGCHVESLVRG